MVVDTGADATTLSPKSWPPDWPPQEVDIQFQGVRTSEKQNIKWLKYLGPEDQTEKINSYMAGTAINL